MSCGECQNLRFRRCSNGHQCSSGDLDREGDPELAGNYWTGKTASPAGGCICVNAERCWQAGSPVLMGKQTVSKCGLKDVIPILHDAFQVL